MTKLFYASTLYGAMSLAAAIDAGLFGARTERWLLLASTNTNAPEVCDSFVDSVAFAPLRQRFDDVVRWNEVIAPMHPSAWVPPSAEVPMLTRLVLKQLDITDAVTELVVESIAVAPARTLGILIRDCPITVYSDGLMSYGPTRDELPVEIGTRTSRVLYLDLVAGVTPMLLRDVAAQPVAIPDAAFGKVISELPVPEVGDAFGWPVIIGQYLSALGIVSVAEENDLYATMLQALVAAGHRQVVFTPHPSAGSTHVGPLRDAANRLGAELVIAGHGLPVESWFAAAHPSVVVSCFSTALFTAGRFFDLPAATVGADLVLQRLRPFENSNRIPATLTHAAVPALNADGSRRSPAADDLDTLVRTVAYCMQPIRNADLRPVAAEYVRTHGAAPYLTARRVESLALLPATTMSARMRRRARRRGLGVAVRLNAVRRRWWTPIRAGVEGRLAPYRGRRSETNR